MLWTRRAYKRFAVFTCLASVVRFIAWRVPSSFCRRGERGGASGEPVKSTSAPRAPEVSVAARRGERGQKQAVLGEACP